MTVRGKVDDFFLLPGDLQVLNVRPGKKKKASELEGTDL